LLVLHREKVSAQLKAVKENLKIVDKKIDTYQKSLLQAPIELA
jgi:hypothetical protein